MNKNGKGKSCFEYMHERNEDLMRAYRKVLSQQFHSNESIILKNVFKEVAEMPAQRFWVSEERAKSVIQSMMHGNKLTHMGKQKKEMFREIYKRYKELKKQLPHMSIEEHITLVCNQQAPKFYLTSKSVKVIIYRIKSKWYEKQRLKLQHSH